MGSTFLAQFGQPIDGIFATYGQAVAGQFAANLYPFVQAALTLWLLLYALAMLRGESREPLTVVVWRLIKTTLIVQLVVNSPFYLDIVFGLANDLQTSAVAMFSPSQALRNAPSAWSVLDAAWDQTGALLKQIWQQAGITALDYVAAGVCLLIGAVIFMLVALVIVIISKVVTAFLIGVGPIFVLALLFKPTHRFFEAWLSTLLSATIIVWFSMFALGLGIDSQARMLTNMLATGDFITLASTATNVLTIVAIFVITQLASAYLVFNAPAFASGLTSGVGISQGGNILSTFASARMALRNFGGRNPPASAGSNTLRPGGWAAGLGYGAGSAARAGADAAASAVVPAYRRVAEWARRRGRT
jgi:type IV secretion system protein VirB6